MQLIRCYHAHLAAYLQQFNYPRAIPTEEEIIDHCRKSDIYSCFLSILIIVLRHLPYTYGEGLTGFMESSDAAEAYRIEMFSMPAIRDEATYLLKYFDSIGVFDL